MRLFSALVLAWTPGGCLCLDLAGLDLTEHPLKAAVLALYQRLGLDPGERGIAEGIVPSVVVAGLAAVAAVAFVVREQFHDSLQVKVSLPCLAKPCLVRPRPAWPCPALPCRASPCLSQPRPSAPCPARH